MMHTVDSAFETVLRRDKLVVIGALVVIIALSWAYLLAGAGMGMSGLEMTRMSQHELTDNVDHATMMHPAVWTPGYAVLMFCMWWIMMIAMMLPSAAPLMLVFATVIRRQCATGRPHVATAIFAFGYLAAWAGYSLAGVLLQWVFERIGILSPMLVLSNDLFVVFLLLAAGLYQLTPIKRACLRYCRSPLDFLNSRWRSGAAGALLMGFSQGATCVGCCWFLMALMFVGGLMNLYWIAGLALLVLLEKVIPGGQLFGHATGIGLLVASVGVLALT